MDVFFIDFPWMCQIWDMPAAAGRPLYFAVNLLESNEAESELDRLGFVSA